MTITKTEHKIRGAKKYKFVVDKSEVAAVSFVFNLSDEDVEQFKMNANLATSKLFNYWKKLNKQR